MLDESSCCSCVSSVPAKPAGLSEAQDPGGTCTAHTGTKLINQFGQTATARFPPSRWQIFSKAVHQKARQLSLAAVKSPANIHFFSLLILSTWPMTDSQSHLQLLLQYYQP